MATLATGTVLDGRYKIRQKLAEGGFGETYRARDLKRPGHPLCVVKRLHPQHTNPKIRQFFDQEAAILERLGRHDQIPQLLAHFQEGNEFYIVQEFIEGQPLSVEIQPGKPLGEAAVSIPGGRFTMGSPEGEVSRDSDEGPQHEVTVPAFFMGRYAVTQAQWRVVAGYDRINLYLNPDPARFKGDDRPVEQVSWEEAQEFCQRLAAKTGKAYRLPTEAEWEYACRAGTSTPFHFGETLTSKLANYAWTYAYASGPKESSYPQETMNVNSFFAKLQEKLDRPFQTEL